MLRPYILLLFVTFVSAKAIAHQLPEFFYSWINSPSMCHATVCLEIAELTETDDPEVLYSYDAQRSVTPASVMKLLTTATALEVLGGDKRIETEVGYRGEVTSEGVLRGDLIILGHGNAMLSSMWSQYPRDAFARSVVAAIKKKGIRHIEGRVIGDGRLLSQSPIPVDWTWEDIGNHYAAGISGLNYSDNAYTIVLNTAERGKQPQVQSVIPTVDGLVLDNQLLALNYSHDSAYIYGAPGSPQRVIYGAVPHTRPQFRIKGDVPDPPQFAASCIRRELIQAGIRVDGSAVNAASVSTLPAMSSLRDAQGVTPLYTHLSEPLQYMARQTNEKSLNLMAEMLLRQLALSAGDGSETSGIRAIMSYWQKQGVDLSGIQIYDGCGLAPSDRLTARFVNRLLAKMHHNADFVASLPVAGKTGTIRNFLKNTHLEGRACLKTGTTKQVIAYAGYIKGSDGRQYVCSIFVNNHTCKPYIVRKNIEKLLQMLIS